MEKSAVTSFIMDSFSAPSEPRPLSSLESDEESFVVLGKSLSPDSVDNSLPVRRDEPIGTTVVEEAKQIINKELREMEQMSLKSKFNFGDIGASKETGNEVPILQICPAKPETPDRFPVGSSVLLQNHSQIRTEPSSDLPEMPHVSRGFETSNAISITTFTNDLTSEEVQNKISQIIEENIHLKDTILQNNMSMKSQYERIVAWQDDVQKVHQAHRDKILEAKDIIEKLRKENSELRVEISIKKEIMDVQAQKLMTLERSLAARERQVEEKLVKSTDKNLREFELDGATKKIEELEIIVQNLTAANTALKSENQELSEKLKSLDEIQKQGNDMSAQAELLKSELAAVKAAAINREKDYNAVIDNQQIQLAALTQHQVNLPSPEELINVKTQLTNTQVILTQVQQGRNEAYAQVHTLENEVEKLNEKIQGLGIDMRNEIFVLETQLKIYKDDFEAERIAKEALKEEKEKLTEDLQNLQRRNQQLQEEIELIREHRDFHVYSSASGAGSSPNDHSMKCPKCNFGFTTVQALENHVYRCIDLDEHLP